MSKTILLIDDSETQRQVMKMSIEAAGFVCAEAEDGYGGLKQLETMFADIALILCDVNMPNMDGLTFVENMKKVREWSHIPIVMLTTETSNDLKLQGRALGVVAWAAKPCAPEKLLKVIEKILGTS